MRTANGHIAAGLGLLALILTMVRLVRGELTWKEFFIGIGIGTLCSVVGLYKIGAF